MVRPSCYGFKRYNPQALRCKNGFCYECIAGEINEEESGKLPALCQVELTMDQAYAKASR
jgi:hypothetical protein